MERNSSFATKRLVTIAFLIALEIVLSRFASISTPLLRVGISFLPIVVTAIMYGPMWAGAAYVISDTIGMMLFPTGGVYFPGFTLSAFLSGVIYGLVLYKHNVTPLRAFAACTIVLIGINLLLNTYWLTIMYGDGYLALLPARAIKEFISIPINTALVTLMYSTVIKRIQVGNLT